MVYGSPQQQMQGNAEPADPGYDPHAVYKEATERFSQGLAFERKNRDAAKEDLDFLAGDQWHRQDLAARQRDKRPTLTINRLPQHLKQVSNEIRKNPPGIQVSVGDGAATPKTALVFEGMIRAIERVSGAARVYSRAGEQAAGCGMGHFRLCIERENPMRFDRALRIKSIRNPFSVVWDPAAVMDDKSDAMWAFVYEEMPEAEFKRRYPNTKVTAWAVANPTSNSSDGWKSQGKNVTVAEYWVVKEEPVPIVEVIHNRPTVDEWGYPTPPTGRIDILEAPDPMILMEAQQMGFSIRQQGIGMRKSVCMYLLGGNGVIEGPHDKDGWSRIPIFTVPGDEYELGTETLRGSLIRFAKDAQRMLNYYVSKDVEMHALAPLVPFILTKRQIAGLENMWATLNQVNRPYVVYNDVDDDGDLRAPRPSREPGIGTNPGLMAGAQAATQYIKDVTGIYDASLGNRSNETSGVAIEARDAQSDTGSFNYIDNLAFQVEVMGRELVHMIPRVYSPDRQIRIIGRDDAQAVIDLSRETDIDLSRGKYDVVVKIGPAFETQRQEMIDGMGELAKAAPPPIQVLLFTEIAKLRDFHGSEELAARIERVAKAIGMLPPDPEDMAPPMAMGPDGAPMPAPPPGMPPGRSPMPMPPGGPMDPLGNVIPFPPAGAPAPGQRVAPAGRAGIEGAYV